MGASTMLMSECWRFSDVCVIAQGTVVSTPRSHAKSAMVARLRRRKASVNAPTAWSAPL